MSSSLKFVVYASNAANSSDPHRALIVAGHATKNYFQRNVVVVTSRKIVIEIALIVVAEYFSPFVMTGSVIRGRRGWMGAIPWENTLYLINR